MEPLRRTDVLAAYLLFATLGLAGLELAVQLLAGWLAPHRDYLPATWATVGPGTLVLLVALVLRAGVYYAIRHGYLAAKLLLALGFAAFAWLNTNWRLGVVAGVLLAPFNLYSLLALLTDVLTLAALVLAFWPGRQPTAARR